MKTGDYGLYKLPSSIKATNRYRFGNHPIRLSELVREYGAAALIEVSHDREVVRIEARRRNAANHE